MSIARPNFFVGIRLACPLFADAIVSIQNHVIRNAPHLQKCRMDPQKLHLTCFVLALTNSEQIQKAAQCLLEFQDELSSMLAVIENKYVSFNSMGNFSTKVLYAEPVQDEVMATLAAITVQLEARFIACDLIQHYPGVGRPWCPHATILKTSYDRKNGNKLKIRPPDYAGMDRYLQLSEERSCSVDAMDLDPIPVKDIRVQLTTIDLLSMQEIQSDGYYRSYAHINF